MIVITKNGTKGITKYSRYFNIVLDSLTFICNRCGEECKAIDNIEDDFIKYIFIKKEKTLQPLCFS